MWIVSLTFELIECCARMVITRTPDSGEGHEEYVFKSVGRIQVDRYHDVEDVDVTLGDFSGLKITEVNESRSSYAIDTGDALVSFKANTVYELTRL